MSLHTEENFWTPRKVGTGKQVPPHGDSAYRESTLVNEVEEALADVVALSSLDKDPEEAITGRKLDAQVQETPPSFCDMRSGDLGLASRVDISENIDSNSQRDSDSRDFELLKLKASQAEDRYEEDGQLLHIDDAVVCYHQALTIQPDNPDLHESLGLALASRFKETSCREDIDQSIAHHVKSYQLYPLGEEESWCSLFHIGSRHIERFEHFQDMQDLEASISYLQQAQIGQVPNLHNVFCNLTMAFELRYNVFQDPNDLNHAIDTSRRALECYHGDDDDLRSRNMYNLAAALSIRISELDDTGSLDEGIMHHRAALALRPPSHPEHFKSLAGVASLLSQRFLHSGALDDLDGSIHLWRNALTLYPEGFESQRCLCFAQLGATLYLRFKENHLLRDLDDAIEHNRTALALHPEHTTRLKQLAESLLTRYEQPDSAMADLDEAIQYHTRYLELAPPGDINHPEAVFLLVGSVVIRYRRLQRIQDLETLISCNTKALDFEPVGSRQRLITLEAIGDDTLIRYHLLGQSHDLEKAVTYREEAFQSHPPDDPDYYLVLHYLADALRMRFDELGQMEDIDRSIELHHKAVTLCPMDNTNRTRVLMSLMSALATRFLRKGESAMEDIHAANELSRVLQASLQSVGDDLHVLLFLDLATVAGIRFEILGSPDDLDDSIRLREQIQSIGSPSDWPPQIRYLHLNGLGLASYRRFLTRGDLEDLNRAVAYHCEALPVLPQSHGRYALNVFNLISALVARFEIKGNPEDIDTAISHARDVLSLSHVQEPQRFQIRTVIANALVVRNRYHSRPADLREALQYYHEAKELCFNETERWQCFTDIGRAYFERFRQEGLPDDLDKAINYFDQALLISRPTGHCKRSVVFYSLGICYLYRYLRLRNNSRDLDKAIALNNRYIEEVHKYGEGNFDDLAYGTNSLSSALMFRFTDSDKKDIGIIDSVIGSLRQLIDRSPFYSVPRHSMMTNLGRAFLLRFEATHQQLDLDEACIILKNASTQEGVAASQQVIASQMWAVKAKEHNHESALEAYSCTLSILQQYLDFCPNLAIQHGWLAQYSTGELAVDAASCAIERGQPEVAIETLELGRGMTWTMIRRFRSPLLELQKIDAELAREFQDTCSKLERLATIAKTEKSLSEAQVKMLDNQEYNKYYEAEWTEQRHLKNDWDTLLKKIREQKGLSEFLKPFSFHNIQQGVVDGPIITINLSKYRCDAIIVTSDKPPVLVSLSSGLRQLSLNLADEMRTLARGRLSMDDANTFEQDSVLSDHDDYRMLCILEQLWIYVGKPISKQLLNIGIEKGSHIWWCPTGALTSLPIHAAGMYLQAGENMLDMFISSYAPTIASLITARRNMADRSQHSMRLLAVGQSKALPKVVEEFRAMQEITKGQAVVRDNDDAEPLTVLQSLREHSWVHFACHGVLNSARPHFSSFTLSGQDPKLQLINILEAQLPYPELAFLAACHSAAAKVTDTMDEVITLSSAMQFCGFSSVIGTLWEMADEDGPSLARDFYGYMLRNGPDEVDVKESAEALNLAVKNMRDRDVPASRWSTFIHIGV